MAPLLWALNFVLQSTTLCKKKVWFFRQLAAQLPDAAPCVQTDDGQVEVLWEDESRLTITLTDDDSVVVSTADGNVSYFEKEQLDSAVSLVVALANLK